jgi:LCP family protein required for cell wall assembly
MLRSYGVLAKAGYPLACVFSALVLVISGAGYLIVRDISGIGGSHAIVSGPSTGPQNILLMGLESRTDWNGNILPQAVLNELHAGSRRGIKYEGVGGNATNTLILIHLFGGGKRAVGFSIPRDDWVTFADTVGQQQVGKIDQAYGASMYYKEGELRAKYPDISYDRVAFLGNEAGRAATVATVEKLTGVHIDHFAEVNLDGFYELAKVFGRVEVCLKHPVHDPYSGANFKAGYQWLDPSQALAFVRQRHGLPNGDLDRTHRQQAFIDSVMHQLRTEGIISDLSKLEALLTVARRYVITDSGWNLLDFAAETRGLTSGNLVFHTLPIVGYSEINGQDVNLVDPRYIKSIVKAAFARPPRHSRQRHDHRHRETAARPAKPATVDVYNGGYTAGLAGRVSAALVQAGYRAGKVANTTYRTTTAVIYGSGAAASAGAIAKDFGVTATSSASVAPGHVQVLLGASAVVPVITASPKASTSHRPTAIPTKGAQGGAVRAKDGIPCVD